MKDANFTLRKSQPEFTDIGTPIIYETVPLSCEVAAVDPRIVDTSLLKGLNNDY